VLRSKIRPGGRKKGKGKRKTKNEKRGHASDACSFNALT